jgi:hypothetical protein
MGELIEITLRYNMDDLYDDQEADRAGADEGSGERKLTMVMGTSGDAREQPRGETRSDEELFDGEITFDVEPVAGSPGHFRMPEPVSITPFGPFGPSFSVGDVIATIPHGDGTYVLKRVVMRADSWSKYVSGVTAETLEEPQLVEALHEFYDLGGGWEFATGNLTLQYLKMPDEPVAPAAVLDLFDRIEAAATDGSEDASRSDAPTSAPGSAGGSGAESIAGSGASSTAGPIADPGTYSTAGSIAEPIDQMRQDILAIALDGGRMVGSSGHDHARDHLVRRLMELGLEPYADDSFELPYEGGSMHGCNVLGVVPGANSDLAPLLLAAHYDSVIAAPCADDNAAAVAIALRLAERIRPGRLGRDLVVALFDAEEPPYFQSFEMGSIRFFNEQMDGRGVHCAVVMDLVGHDVPVPAIGPALMAAVPSLDLSEIELLKEIVFMTGAESHAELPGVVRGALESRSLRLVAALNRYIGDMSDHHVFRINGVPYLFFSCGRWPHYHQPTDTIEKLNFEKMLRIAEFLEGLVPRLDQAVRQLDCPNAADHSLDFELETLRDSLGKIFPLLALMLGKNDLRDRRDMDAVAKMLLGMGL